MSDHKAEFEGWAILELMGHRRLAGYLRSATVGGHDFLRIDVPAETDGEFSATQFYGPQAIYCITPVTEVVAKQVAKANRPHPVERWELPPPTLCPHGRNRETTMCEVCEHFEDNFEDNDEKPY